MTYGHLKNQKMKLISLATVLSLISASSCAHNHGNNQVAPATPAYKANNQVPNAPVKGKKLRNLETPRGENLNGKFDNAANFSEKN